MTLDSVGSFLPPEDDIATPLMVAALNKLITTLVKEKTFRFYTPQLVAWPEAKAVGGGLSTCVRFEVTDEKQKKVMHVKFYDKMVEQFGRDGYKLVGSKLNRVIESTRGCDDLQKKYRKAKMEGLTRTEVSFMFDDSDEYSFNSPFMVNMFHRTAESFLHRIIASVLNN